MDRNLQSPCHVRPLRCRRCCCDYWRRFRWTSEHSVSSSVEISSSSNNYYVDFAAAAAVRRKTRTSHMHRTRAIVKANKVSARGTARRYAPSPRRCQFDDGRNRGGSTSVRGRVRSPHISGGQRCASCSKFLSTNRLVWTTLRLLFGKAEKYIA